MQTQDNAHVFNNEIAPLQQSLYDYALSKTHDKDDALDLVQNTLMTAYRFLDHYRPGTNAKGWLFLMCKNLYINDYRRRQKLPQGLDIDSVWDFVEILRADTARERDEYHAYGESVYDDDVEQALSEIPEPQREIVRLRDIDGLEYEEIAEHLRIPIGTVRSRLNRARASLQPRLKKYAIVNGYLSASARKRLEAA